MGLIPQNVIDDVLARTDIYQTVTDYVNLKRSGSNHKGLCPFHDEKTPSFYVHQGKQIYKCFGCGAGGNVINFLMEIEGWNFPETVRRLAERHRIEIPEDDPEAARRAKKRREGKKLYAEVMAKARSFYEDNLWGDVGRAARQYLGEREIDDETARAFGLGYAPDGWQNLLDHLAKKGVEGKLAERAGLAMARRNSSGHYDRFRHRVIFPVVDIWGHTLAFGGRRLAADDDSPKYINSPETKFYTKGEHLYGLDVAKTAIQKAGWALLVEGNFDVVVLHAKGIDVAVAPMGTALTEAQARLLARYADRVVIAFDGDDAGEKATLRCLEPLQSAALEARVIRFDEGDDPDSFVRRHGAQALTERVEAAQPLLDWALDQLLPAAEYVDVDSKLSALEEVSELLSAVDNPVAFKHCLQVITRRLDVEPSVVRRYVRRPQEARRAVARELVAEHRAVDLEETEKHVLLALTEHPGWMADFFANAYDHLLSSQEMASFLRQLHDDFQDDGELKLSRAINEIENRPFRHAVEQVLVEGDLGALPPEERQRAWYDDCVRKLKRAWAARSMEALSREIEQLGAGDDRWRQLYKQKQELEAMLVQLDPNR